MKVLDLPKAEKRLSDYVILLRNGKTIEVKAEVYDVVTDDDGNGLLYRFYKAKHAVLELECVAVHMVADKDSVDVDAAITALLFKPRRKKSQ
jgi:hypothetical protein